MDPETCTLLTSFLAIFGVVFLNLEVLKRFMFPSQIDFRAFRVSVELVGSAALCVPTAADSFRFCRAVFVRFRQQSNPIGRKLYCPVTVCHHVQPWMINHSHHLSAEPVFEYYFVCFSFHFMICVL